VLARAPHSGRMHWTDLAAGQAGLITRHQLLDRQIASSTLDRWLAGERLGRTPTDGVYRVRGAPETGLQPAWYAVLSAGSPLSFLSGAWLWDVPLHEDGLVHITRFDRRRLDWPPGVRVHRVGLDPSAVTRRHGLLVTTRSETVLDCLGWLSLGRAGTLADRAVQEEWVTPADVGRRLTEQGGRWGNRQLRQLLPRMRDGAHAESERRMAQLLRGAGVTGWVVHLPFLSAGRRFELDFAFPAQRIAIEIDGYRYHSESDRFQRDRTKQNALVAAGWRVLRFTWADITERPAAVLAEVTQLLAA
jgi:very-short-patch-repair endonuclease